MHPLTLRFEPRLEQEFLAEFFDRTLVQVRLAIVLALFLYTIFGVLDTYIAPEQRRALWFIRFAIEDPVLLLVLAFTFSPRFNRYREHALLAVVLILALGIVAMTSIIPPPGSYLYYAGLILVIVYAFTLLRLNLRYSTTASLAVIVAYVAVALWLNPTRADLIVNNVFFLISASIIGLTANYSMDRYARSNFLQRRLISRRTRELEDANALLVAKNHMLAESRAETIRTAQRSDMIFSALAEALPGRVLDDKYRIDQKIGSGSFGTVYRGVHLLLNHPVAIKVFRPAIGSGATENLGRFRLEGISACRINHANAVTVLDFSVSADSLAYLVMELLEGRSLADELRAETRLDQRRAMHIAASVCDALAEAHLTGVVHRDIKPSNVFLHRHKGDDLVKVIDFGIAKLTDERPAADSPTVTMAGRLVGTPEYMAPERVNGEPCDGRSDVYAVGVMLFEMLTGQLPFVPKDGGYWSVAMMQVSREPRAPSALAPDIAPELDALVLSALAKERERRPSALSLAAQLRELAAA